MPEVNNDLPQRNYGVLVYWGINTLMLALFLSLESAGFKMPVGSSLFYFTWIAIWIMHGLTLVLSWKRDRESVEGDATAAGKRFWRRMVLAGHSALYVAFGPAIILWWLMSRSPGPQQLGEGQGLWVYPVWLMILLAHSAYVMRRERQPMELPAHDKRKRDLPSLKRLIEAERDEAGEWDEDGELMKVEEDNTPLKVTHR